MLCRMKLFAKFEKHIYLNITDIINSNKFLEDKTNSVLNTTMNNKELLEEAETDNKTIKSENSHNIHIHRI